MKSFKVLLLAAIFLCSSVVIVGACEKSSQTSTAQACNGTKVSNKKAVFNISAVKDGCCASKVQSALTSADGVKSCDVNMKTGKCEVEFNDQQISTENLLTTVGKCGFKASLAYLETLEPAEEPTKATPEAITQKAVLNVSGMTCGGCASEVKSALMKVEGVQECKVSWKDGKAEVGFCCDPAKANDLVKAVNKTGFKASLANVQSLEAVDDDEENGDDGEDADEAAEVHQTKQMTLNDKETFKATNYVCEDCGYRQAKAGNCPMDGTKLNKVTEKHTFVCEECDYAQAKAGLCPGHKTALVEYSVKYECPACKMVYETAGMCSMCKKQLEMATDKPVETQKKVMKETTY